MKSDLRLFMAGLTELTKRYGYKISACGCCDSPWVVEAKSTEGAYNYQFYNDDGEEGIDALSWQVAHE